MISLRSAPVPGLDIRNSVASIVIAIGIATGCASPSVELARASTSSTLIPAEASPSDVLVGIPAAIEDPAVDEDSRESETLRLARRVLEQKGSKKLDADQREAVARAITAAESQFGLSVIFSLAIMELESRFDPNAKGPAGSIGLMQLQPATARALAQRYGFEWRGERTLRDPETNARLGLAYLGELHVRFGRTDHAIAAYNIGPGNLRRLLARRPLGRGPYLTKVYANVDALREQYGE
jgi:soluble lytic murein transglycosylase-like protein